MPRSLKGVAVVGKIRFGVELVFSIVIVSEIPLLSGQHSLTSVERPFDTL